MRFVIGTILAVFLTVPMYAQKGAADRLKAATEDLDAMAGASDKGIPETLLSKAQCVAVIPNVKAGGFIVGGEYGKGFFSCRKKSGVGWSAPGSIRIAGGKFGLLIGGKETDVIMLIMHERGMNSLLSDKFQMGGELSGAAGPIGRDSTAMTDAQLKAEILTYSRSRGIFGGIDLSGSTVTQDTDSNKELYGSAITNKEILNGNPPTPAEAKPLLQTLTRLSSRK